MLLVWIASGTALLLLVVVAAVVFCRQASPYDRAQREYHEARVRVDEVLQDAKVRMEEVAGTRQPGERRTSDSFGSWHGWL